MVTFAAPEIAPGSPVAGRPAPAGAAASGCAEGGVARLGLTTFRNYAALILPLDAARPVVLVGANGAGKTNLLEALSLLGPGRGLRGARLEEMVPANSPPGTGWAVAARLAGPDGPLDLGTGLTPPDSRRQVRLDGLTARGPAALANHLALLWLTPAMDRLLAEAPADRRRFVDRLALGARPDHAASLAAFEQAHRRRLRLLRDGPADPAWLDGLEDAMARHGVAVAATRRATVGRLAGVLAERADGPFPAPRLALAGLVEGWLDTMPALAAEDALREHLAAHRDPDSPGDGPQRSDLVVHDAATGQPARLCSTGEQKALLIAIVLAQARLLRRLNGRPPLLLLDEVVAHLDPGRRRALFDELADLGGQPWLSGTDPGLFDGLADRAQVLSVGQGTAHPLT
ncbi:DNA replication/repair protein RecF [Roseospirillum parvum]|uniref:DNA replication and repair protein RecF n=1 Tax=Roseospirillum parvum TaxID=83401 RepID=A0A1G7ZVB0_9PROT|nr:DNA replication/repair protein RecF [Roseospirillum parvum]SDH12592.1 DNA replication and repair protein RecF [Roseospirillum parvum]